MLAEEAKKRQVLGGKEKVVQKIAQAGKARDQVSKLFGVRYFPPKWRKVFWCLIQIKQKKLVENNGVWTQ